jgi:hypothetical protein
MGNSHQKKASSSERGELKSLLSQKKSQPTVNDRGGRGGRDVYIRCMSGNFLLSQSSVHLKLAHDTAERLWLKLSRQEQECWHQMSEQNQPNEDVMRTIAEMIGFILYLREYMISPDKESIETLLAIEAIWKAIDAEGKSFWRHKAIKTSNYGYVGTLPMYLIFVPF